MAYEPKTSSDVDFSYSEAHKCVNINPRAIFRQIRVEVRNGLGGFKSLPGTKSYMIPLTITPRSSTTNALVGTRTWSRRSDIRSSRCIFT